MIGFGGRELLALLPVVGLFGGVAWAIVVLNLHRGPLELTPWQQRTRIGLPAAITGSVLGLFRNPAHFFRCVHAGRDQDIPLVFVFLLPALVAPLAVVHDVLGLTLIPTTSLSLAQAPVAMAVAAVIAPVVSGIGFFVMALVDHVALLVVGGRGDLTTTLRVGAYSTSVNCAAFVPFVGAAFALVAWPAMKIAGYSECHEISRWRTAIAVLLPQFLCLGGIVFALVALSNGSAFAPFIYTLF